MSRTSEGRILVMAPHPDDEVLGCGGAMARHHLAGDEVWVIVVTKGAPDMFPPQRVERTRAELARAHEVLGVKRVIFLDFPAVRLDTIPGHEIADAVRKEIVKLRPDVVYFPHQGDIHSDHKCVYWATLVASRPSNGYTPSRLLCYETLSETEWGSPSQGQAFMPTVFINISDFLSKKLEAMACYKSKFKTPPHSRSLEAIEALAKYRGATICTPAAEAFMLVREIER